MQTQSAPKLVRIIPPKPEFSGENRIDIRPKRVAAYCRVSTDKEQQEHSFETQKEMYTDMIMMKPNWQMAGIYADEGITGTIAKKRPDFMRMIEDCRKGKIDLIITKSVSRFSRNKGDALLQKTYIVDCISKKSKKNNGELPMYYVENNHPAIIERAVFDRVQEEISRRNSKKKVKQIGTKTELGKYSSKYALSEILYCGNCGTPYRRCTWSKNGKKKIVWRCISRLDYGTKYCKDSPSIEESLLHNAITEAITKKAQMENADVDRIRRHIELYKNNQDTSGILAKQERLKTIQEHINQLTDMDSEAAQNGDFDKQFESLYAEMYAIKDELEKIEKSKSKIETAADSIEEMTAVMQGLKNHPVEYNDQAVRQLIECIKVISKDKLHIYFKDGIKIEAQM